VRRACLLTSAEPTDILWAYRSDIPHDAVSVFLGLASTYAVLLVAALATGPEGGFDYEGIRAALQWPVGFLAGWTHYLAFDLFVGAWIVRESRRIGVGPRIFLFFTLMAGPIGLGSFLVRRWWRLRSLGQIGDPDLA